MRRRSITLLVFTCFHVTILSGAARAESLWIFAVGVSQYQNRAISLDYADHDAVTLAKTLAERSQGLFRQVFTTLLTNEQGTGDNILLQMRSFLGRAKAGDTVVIALMGHAVLHRGSYYFLPYSADLKSLPGSSLSLSQFQEAVTDIVGKGVQRLVLAIDTCHAGALDIKMRGVEALRTTRAQVSGVQLANGLQPERRESYYILSASTKQQESLEDGNYRLPGEEKGHGAFTYALLRGLRGEADSDKDGNIQILDLFNYVKTQVPKITGGIQNPYFRFGGTTFSNFSIARIGSNPAPMQSQQALALVDQGVRAMGKGRLGAAQSAFANAKRLNPRSDIPAILEEKVEEEARYQNPRRANDILETARRLVAAYKRKPKAPHLDDPWAPRPMVVAFLGFETLGAGGTTGLHAALAHRLGQTLQGTKRVRIVERKLIDKVLEELKLSATDLVDPATRLKIGRILAARLITTGDIVAISNNQFVVNLRVIDTETSEIKINLSQQLTNPNQILMAADEIASQLSRRLKESYPIRGRILVMEPNEIIVNVGAKHGVVPDMKMKVIREVPLKVQGRVVAMRKRAIGEISIVSVEDEVAFARASNGGAIQKDSKIIEAANQSP